MNTFTNYVISVFEAVIGEINYYSPSDYYNIEGIYTKINQIIHEVDLNKSKFIDEGKITEDQIDQLNHMVEDYSSNLKLQELFKENISNLSYSEREEVINNFNLNSLLKVLDIVRNRINLNAMSYSINKNKGESGTVYKMDEVFKR